MSKRINEKIRDLNQRKVRSIYRKTLKFWGYFMPLVKIRNPITELLYLYNNIVMIAAAYITKKHLCLNLFIVIGI